MKGLSLEVRVGLLILVSIGILVGLLFLLGGIDLGDKHTVYVDFNNPGNVKPGAGVNIGSVRVGSVEAIEYRGGKLDPRTGRRSLIRMELAIDSEVKDTLHEDALFYITSQSLLGESVVAIDPGTWEKPVLEDGAIVQGVDPPRLDLAMALAYELLDNIVRLVRENREELEGMLTNLASILRAMNEILTEHHEQLGQIIDNVDSATGEATELIRSVRGTVDGPQVQRSIRNLDRTLAVVARDIDPILSDVREASAKANDALDMLGPDQRQEVQQTIHHAAELAENADRTIADAREIVAHIRAGRGTVGAMVMDEELYDDIQEMLRDLKHNPWKLFWRE